ncbi:peptidase, partial [Thraustotheca clavata]
MLRLLSCVIASTCACTIIAVGKQASTTGAPLATHTADCGNCDFRIGKVPSKTFTNDSMRDIVQFRLEYPRYVGNARGNVFKLENVDTSIYNWTTTKSIGQIPQVPKTNAYIAGMYGIMNEYQVSIGESTCGGKLVAKPISAGGNALFDISELTNVALERASTAREAIKIMGKLAETYGFYGADWTSSNAQLESGEALAVADPTEVWIVHFHPDDTGASAVWVAQRVPDNHITVVANQFTIHHVNLSDTNNFMGSANMVDVAIRANLYDPQLNGTFDFTRVYAHPIAPDQYYATRRVWRVFTLTNPSLELSPYTDTFALDYPFSITVPSPLSPHDLMRYMRDHYENTPFDMTKGMASGPFGDPDRYDINANGNMTRDVALTGHFERAISIFRTSISFVSVANANDSKHGMIWFGQYGPHATSYVPIYTHVNEVPEVYTRGSLYKYDHSTGYWAFAMVGNWAARFYGFTRPLVASVQEKLEVAAEAAQQAIQTQASQLFQSQGDDAFRKYLTNQSQAMATNTHTAFVDLFSVLVTTFHDGYHMHNLTGPTIEMQSLFYPKW